MTPSNAARRTRSLPRGLFALGCGALALCGQVTSIVIDSHGALAGHAYEDTVIALIWAALAAMLATKAPRHPVVTIFLAVAAAAAVAVASGAYALVAHAQDHASAAPAAWLSDWVWVISTFVPVTILTLTFPSGRIRDHPVSGTLALVAMALMCTGLATAESIATTPENAVPNPLHLGFSDGLFVAGSVLAVVPAILAIAGLIKRLRATGGIQRRQVAPVAVAAVVTLFVLAASAFLPEAGPYLQLAVSPILPGAVALSILQYRLYDVEVVVRRSLVFAGLTVVVVGGYLLIVQATANLLHRQAGMPESLVAAGAVALAFQPAQAAMRRGVGRWVYGDRDTPHRALLDVMHQLSAAAEPHMAVEAATERLRWSLRVPWVQVTSAARVLASNGDRPSWADDGTLTTVGLRHLGIVRGCIMVAPRAPREALSARDHLLLQQLAEPVAAVVATQQLVSDLQLSRERVVLAREEERRRLRRDLHDGVGPLLSALVAHADVVALRSARGGGGPVEPIDKIRRIAHDAIAGLRHAIDNLQPTNIDELGLDGAIAELCITMSGTGPADVRLVGGLHGPAPAAVELAAYLVAAEAATNALRHGGAAHVTIALCDSPEHIGLDIRDDGPGLGAVTTAGVGIASMRERVEELGGDFILTSSSEGVHVTATFPRHQDRRS